MRFLTGLIAAVLAFSVQAAPDAEKWSFWEEAGTATGVDHSQWQTVLDDFIVQSEDSINRVRYTELRESDETLNQYIEYLASLDPRDYTMDEQMAYWVNMYNALTLQVVLAYPSKGSILRMGKKFFAIGPWDDKVVTVAGEEVTLNDIEHRILRPIWQDKRIHYAVNCASIGCPNLSAQAFTAENLEAQLNAAEIAYLEHPRGVSVDKKSVTLSSIFKWYRSDFGESESDVLNYIKEFNADVAGLLANEGDRVKVKYDYDWALNAADKI